MTSRKPLGLLRPAGSLLTLLLPAGLMLRASAQVSGGGYGCFPTGAVVYGNQDHGFLK